VLTNTTSGAIADCTLNDSPNAVLQTDPNTSYTASLWVKAPTAGATLTLRLREYNGSTFLGQQTATIVLSTSWQQISLTYASVKAGTTLDYTAYLVNAAPGVCFLADDAAETNGTVAAQDSPPVAALSLSAASGRAPLAVTADASGSTDTDATPIGSYRFDFGDGTVVGPQMAASAAHTYTAPGAYTVTVSVTDTANQVSTATAPVTVSAALGTQFFSNPGFENGVTGWNVSGRAEVTLATTTDAHSGAAAAVLTNTSTGSVADCTLNDSPNAVLQTDPSSTYTASLWVKAPTAGATLTLRIREYDGSTFLGQQTATIVLSTSWQQISLTYASVKAGTTLDYTAYLTNAAPGVCFIADDAAETLIS
jgi:PKD repeat protein